MEERLQLGSPHERRASGGGLGTSKYLLILYSHDVIYSMYHKYLFIFYHYQFAQHIEYLILFMF